MHRGSKLTVKNLRKNKGFTLIELIVSMVVISVSLVGTLLAFDAATKTSGKPVVTHQLVSIARSYAEEVLTKEFPTTLPCPSPPASRLNYTNICDYNNLTDNGVKDHTGASVSGLEKYNVSVSLDTATASLSTLTSGTEVVRIDISVNLDGEIGGTNLSVYKTKY